MKFWKSGRRKVFAVNIDSHAQDAHGGSTNKKRKRPLESIDEDHETEAMFTELKEDIHEIKETICDILQVSSFQKVPVGLQRVLVDAFECKICTQLSQPPVVIMKCCKVILGCSNCCKEWFHGEDAMTKLCPLRRAVKDCLLKHAFLRLNCNPLFTIKDTPLYCPQSYPEHFRSLDANIRYNTYIIYYY